MSAALDLAKELNALTRSIAQCRDEIGGLRLDMALIEGRLDELEANHAKRERALEQIVKMIGDLQDRLYAPPVAPPRERLDG